MNKIEIFNKLNALNTKINNFELNEIIESLKKDIMLDDIKNTSDRQRTKYCLSALKKNTKHHINFNGCFIDENNNQMITDTYFLVNLVECDYINGFNKVGEIEEKAFKNLKREFALYRVYEYTPIKVNVKDVLNSVKMKEETICFSFVNDDGVKGIIYFNTQLLKDLIYFLNLQNEETFELLVKHPSMPAYIVKENGSWGLILPVKKNNG